MSHLSKLPWKRDIASASPNMLKGKLHEAVVDSAGDPIALCGEDADLVDYIVKASNCYESLIQALLLALPHVEEATFHASYRKNEMKGDLKVIKAAIYKAEPHLCKD